MRFRLLSQRMFIYLTAFMQMSVHYYFLVRCAGIEKSADWADYLVVPVLLASILIAAYHSFPVIGLRIAAPVNILVSAWVIFSLYYFKSFKIIPGLNIFSEMLKSINASTALHVHGLFGWVPFAASVMMLAMTILALTMPVRGGKRCNACRGLLFILILAAFIQPVRVSFDNVYYKYIRHKYRLIANAGLPYFLAYDLYFNLKAKCTRPESDFTVSAVSGAVPEIDSVISRPAKYVFIVQVESLDKTALERTYFGREPTPFLNSLIRRSAYFENGYANHLVGSSDADFCALTSILPFKEFFPYNMDLHATDSLPRYFKVAGGDSFAFHPVRGSFFNRGAAFEGLGFDAYFDEDDFSNASAGWSADDGEFLLESLTKIDSLISRGKPALFYFITIQSHGPFTHHGFRLYGKDQYAKIAAEHGLSDHDAVRMLDYLNSIYETDAALGKMFEELAKKDYFNDAVFIIFSDHTSGIRNAVYDSSCGNSPGERIPFIIFGNMVYGGRFAQPVEHLDIPPTVAFLTGGRSEKKWSGSLMFNAHKDMILNNDDGQCWDYYTSAIYASKNGSDSSPILDSLITLYIRYSRSWFQCAP